MIILYATSYIMEHRVFKLIVRIDGNSAKVLRYIDTVIETVNQTGVRFKIIKLKKSDMTKALVQKLESENITRLPAVITDDGKQWIGYKTIRDKIQVNVDLFNQNNARIGMGMNPIHHDGRPVDKQRPVSKLKTMEDVYSEEMSHLVKTGDKYQFDDGDLEDEGMGGSSSDSFRKQMEEFNSRKGSLDAPKSKSNLQQTIQNTKQQQKEGNLQRMNTNNLDPDDQKLLEKLGGLDDGYGDYDDNIASMEEENRRAAMAEFGQ